MSSVCSFVSFLDIDYCIDTVWPLYMNHVMIQYRLLTQGKVCVHTVRYGSVDIKQASASKKYP